MIEAKAQERLLLSGFNLRARYSEDLRTYDFAARAARDLVDAGRDFVYLHGILAWILEMMNRLLPRKLLIMFLGRRSLQNGYLARAYHSNHFNRNPQ